MSLAQEIATRMQPVNCGGGLASVESAMTMKLNEKGRKGSYHRAPFPMRAWLGAEIASAVTWLSSTKLPTVTARHLM